MSKMIYVLDEEPANCPVCPILQCEQEQYRERPADCPLKRMPERKEQGKLWDGVYACGWNDCLKEIGGNDE